MKKNIFKLSMILSLSIFSLNSFANTNLTKTNVSSITQIGQAQVYNVSYAGGTTLESIPCPITKSLFTGASVSEKDKSGAAKVTITPLSGNSSFDYKKTNISVLQK